MSLKKINLVTTFDQINLYKKNNYYLGKWCVNYVKKNKVNNYLAYHWDDISKFERDTKYLDKVYKLKIRDLSKILNTYNNTDYSQNFWEIILGPWLGWFISIIFDRYENIKIFEKKFNNSQTKIINYKLESIIPKNLLDFHKLMTTDKFNHYIFSIIIKHYSNIEYEIIEDPHSDNNKRNYIQSIKTKLINILDLIYLFKFKKNYKRMVYKSSIDKTIEKKLINEDSNFKLLYNFDKINLDINFDPKIRNKIKFQSYKNEFEECLNKLIINLIPTIYLEGFKIMKKRLKILNTFKVEKIFTSALGIRSDDSFMFWTAFQKENNRSNLIIYQHGGGYGISKIFFNQQHELSVCDKFINWGWESDNKKIVNLGFLKIYNKKYKYNKNGHIFIPTLGLPRYSYTLHSIPQGPQVENSINDLLKFLSNINKNIFNNLIIKTKGDNRGWFWKERIQDKFPEIKIDIESNYFDQLFNSSLCICTYNQTTMLESMYHNIPTIIFYKKEYWKNNYENEDDFKMLIDAEILFYNPIEAAKKINKIHKNIDIWWFSEKTQNIKNIFCQKYAKKINKPFMELTNIIDN